ncbi:hypothetical protein B0H65DRAFT_558522 [Neurospora tetraspora]|uniref:Uncharacterized protein n=1 Tax=Neurospora tetraspora TaxID=94610 RepID=A0AAE0JHE4_9PEZI|nr:hypothetical protein B0H65DRAFT_558522 [Neurospora tetraspora]
MPLLSPKKPRRHTLQRGCLEVTSTELFKCGRCGHTTNHRGNHLEHLRIKRPCPEMEKPTMYECKYHGPTSLDREEHITHLKDSSSHRQVYDDK